MLKKILLVLTLLLLTNPAFAAVTVIQQSGNDFKCAEGNGSAASITVNATGGNFIAVNLAYVQASGAARTITDGTNTYSGLTAAAGTPTYGTNRWFYAKNVSSGVLTITSDSQTSTIPTICVIVLAGMHTTFPLDRQSGFTPETTATTIKPGVITPRFGNEIILVAESGASTTIPTIDSSITTSASGFSALDPGVSYALAIGYKIQTTATAIDPTWTVQSGTARAATIVSFEDTSGGGGGTVTAPTCSLTDVQNTIDSVSPGDTVVIPEGSCSWASSLSVNKGITLSGMGTSSTIIIDATAKGDSNCGNVNPLIGSTTGSADDVVRITNFQIIGQDPMSSCGESANHIVMSGATHHFRVDHILFNPQRVTGVQAYADARGVIDHNTFHNPYNNFGVLVQHGSWAGVGGLGDNSWAQADTFGVADGAVYIENNTFDFSGNAFPVGCMDSEAGGRVVFRFNIGCPFVGNHGTESTGRPRSARQFEIYNNPFVAIVNTLGNMYTGVFLRGGTGRVFNNTYTDVLGSTYSTSIQLNNYRDTGNEYTFGSCSGLIAFDTNIGGLFESGTFNGTDGVYDLLTDSTKTWTSDQWKSYSVLNLTQTWESIITATGVHTITSQALQQTDGAMHPHIWHTGDSYQVRKAYPCMDQVGRGAGAYISGNTPSPSAPVNEAADPLYGWGDLHGGVPIEMGSNNLHVLLNRDYHTSTTISSGVFASRPGTCTAGDGYWATNIGTWNLSGSGGQGRLYICVSTNTWSVDDDGITYQPYTYPFPGTAAVASASFTINPATIVQGTTATYTLTGTNTGWVNGYTNLQFFSGFGLTVNSTTCTTATACTASVTAAIFATAATSDVRMATIEP